jgi:hypothetical protein
MDILKFLAHNWDSVLVVVAAIVVVIVLIKRKQIAVLKKILFVLVTRAEEEYENGTGRFKKEAVIGWIYERTPAILRLIITEKDIDKLIEDTLAYAKKLWAENDSKKALKAKSESNSLAAQSEETKEKAAVTAAN